ncbi:hypothetical protein MOC99_08710 [Bacillus haynesii]|uniref:hypothetical protein n=1 Tax=Bacillus haynesii TaxID=1925021 RepID=UPI00227ECF4A|nr:hypothetical protein [Bacillus haynesii]MCY8344043.1 hypothetical protein [Bacillus haynesii]MCY8349940.1 hypothetical protein [Bacillus haynesii]MCY9215393.1 hypothetical protein [Bacillus haynesii]MCY9275547.1 hypothetical protein [Bacillus haynesii]MEC1532907.1 hypothetical protein [Bacillus haynesii]
MNHFYLKEVFVIASNPAAGCRQYMPMICFSAGNKKHEISTYPNEGIVFRYETKDRMEIYEFQVTLKQKELSFRLYAWDGGSYVRVYSERWLSSPVFFQFLKNTYFSNNNEMIFLINGRKKQKL